MSITTIDERYAKIVIKPVSDLNLLHIVYIAEPLREVGVVVSVGDADHRAYAPEHYKGKPEIGIYTSVEEAAYELAIHDAKINN